MQQQEKVLHELCNGGYYEGLRIQVAEATGHMTIGHLADRNATSGDEDTTLFTVRKTNVDGSALHYEISGEEIRNNDLSVRVAAQQPLPGLGEYDLLPEMPPTAWPREAAASEEPELLTFISDGPIINQNTNLFSQN